MRVEAECLKDEQVLQAKALVTYDEDTETKTVVIEGLSSAGPFGLTLSPSTLTAEDLAPR